MQWFQGNLTQRHEICSQELNYRPYAIIRWKPEVSISPAGLESVPRRNRRTDRQNYDSITRLAVRAVVRNKKSELMLMRRATASV